MLETVLNACNIYTNKNRYILKIKIKVISVPGDKSAITPGGIRLGTPSVTSRGMGVNEMLKIAEMIHKAVDISIRACNLVGRKKKDFDNWVENSKD
jgi:glycine hydroxymethyltransferase